MNLMHPILRSIIESAPAYRMPAAEDRIFLLGRTLHRDGEYAWSEVRIREIEAIGAPLARKQLGGAITIPEAY